MKAYKALLWNSRYIPLKLAIEYAYVQMHIVIQQAMYRLTPADHHYSAFLKLL